MGAGIAQVCLEAGHVVVARDVEQRFVDAGVAKIEAGLDKRVEKGLMTGPDAEAARGRLTATTDVDALAGAGIVIEAIVEELAPKQALFAELDRICGADTILATNTSALSVSAVASASSRALPSTVSTVPVKPSNVDSSLATATSRLPPAPDPSNQYVAPPTETCDSG